MYASWSSNESNSWSIDKKTQEDITRCILLQVIAEQEHAGEPLMSRDFLPQIIRSHGGGSSRRDRQLSGAELQTVCRPSARSARAYQDGGRCRSGRRGRDSAQKNYQRWRTVQDEIFRTLMNAASAVRSGNAADEVTADNRPLP